ncbi:MAG: porin [Ignavibacteria bacterium]|nr:porin [Ignavibacteria bacterium]
MKNFTAILVILLVSSIIIKAQDTTYHALEEKLSELKGQVDGINETLLETKTTVDALKKIKLSGYIQAQWQLADRDNTAASFSGGGNFPANSKNRFLVRRGRVKVTYDNDLTQYVLQIDVTQSGVGIKDAYVFVKEPWLKMISLTAGVFDRPFGFEISYSSSMRESPERSRLFQTLFPGERGLGAKLELTPESGPLSFLNLKAGLMNGTGPTATENDNFKDFIGRLGFQLPFEDLNLAVDGGFSWYIGKVTNTSTKIYTVDVNKGFVKDSAATNVGKPFDRTYLGGDVQLYYDLPILGGMTLRGEYIAGKQPATLTSNSFYPGTGDIYLRKFSGFYLMYVQNIGLNHQFVAKYDVFDPNTEVKGDEIGAAGKSYSTTDIKYSTLGLGWVYHWDANVKFTLYYENVKNEKVNASATGSLAPFKEDIKDNVLTIRVQYRF